MFIWPFTLFNHVCLLTFKNILKFKFFICLFIVNKCLFKIFFVEFKRKKKFSNVKAVKIYGSFESIFFNAFLSAPTTSPIFVVFLYTVNVGKPLTSAQFDKSVWASTSTFKNWTCGNSFESLSTYGAIALHGPPINSVQCKLYC